MFKFLLLFFAIAVSPVYPEDALPTAIDCYQTSSNAKDIDAYINCFTEDAEMIDVSRTFNGHDAIRAWALREVINLNTVKFLNPMKVMQKRKLTG